MNANIISNYAIWTSYTYSEEIDKEELEDYLPITSKFELQDSIENYFNNLEIKINPKDNDVFIEGDSYINITNMDELIEYFSYLIEPEKVCINCGKKNDKHFNYCPNCGTKM